MFLGSFIIFVLGICLGLTQLCRLSVVYFLADGIYDLDDPASSDALIVFFVMILALPFMFYVDPVAALTGGQHSNAFISERFFYFLGAVLVSDGLAKHIHEFVIRFTSFLIPASRLDAHSTDREEVKSKFNNYKNYSENYSKTFSEDNSDNTVESDFESNSENGSDNYQEFAERRRREAWASSSFAKDYANYDDYAAQNGNPRAKARTRSYKKTKTQSVPHTPRIGAMRVLGLSGNPSAADIKSAYRKLARKHHPDNFMTQGPQAVMAAEAKMKDINAAYEFMKK